MSRIGTLLYTWWRGELVGEDRYGNRYFREKAGGERRWVVYRGEDEASKVPPEWYGWLHRTTDTPPPKDLPTQPWQKEYVPNLTGTPYAYRPAGHPSQGGRRQAATGDYEAWTPD